MEHNFDLFFSENPNKTNNFLSYFVRNGPVNSWCAGCDWRGHVQSRIFSSGPPKYPIIHPLSDSIIYDVSLLLYIRFTRQYISCFISDCTGFSPRTQGSWSMIWSIMILIHEFNSIYYFYHADKISWIVEKHRNA